MRGEDPGADAPISAPAAVTEDALLGGRVRLLQPRRGYRAGLDAALLAAAVEGRTGERLVELGCGPGAALLQCAARLPETRFVGLERDRDALALARRNLALNGVEARVELVEGAIVEGREALGEGLFDAAFANPPFFDDPGALRGPAPERKGAWLADDGLAIWLRRLLLSVREGGRVTVIHRADRLADLLAGLAKKGGSIRIRPIHPFPDAPAKRVLVRAIRGGRAPLVLLPAVVLHERGGSGHTPEVEAILRGKRALAWG